MPACPRHSCPRSSRFREPRRPQGNLQFYAQLVDKKGKTVGNPAQGAPTFGFNWGTVKALNPYRLEPGSRAPAGSDQVVIDAGSAKDAGFKVGDQVTILTQGPPTKYQIVGIAKFGDADSAAGASAALFDTPTSQAITGAADQFDSISVVAQPGVSQSTLKDRIAAQLDSKTYQVLTGAQITKENQSDIKNALQFFNVALLVFALIALFVGTFIIFNTFSIVVAQRLRELALLRALGASGRQVMGSVLTEAVLVGLSASVIGLGAGIALSSALKALLDAFGLDIPAGGTVVTVQTVIVALVVGTGVTIISAIVPARKASRVPPIAAMRDVATEERPHSGRRVAIGFGIVVLGVLSLFAGLFGDAGIQLVGLGAFDRVHRRVRAGTRGRPSTERADRLAGGTPARHHRLARPRQRDAEPEAHVGDGGSTHDRCGTGGVHHDLRRVGQGVDQRPGRRGVQSRLRDQHRLRLRCLLRRVQPATGERRRQAAAGRRLEPAPVQPGRVRRARASSSPASIRARRPRSST